MPVLESTLDYKVVLPLRPGASMEQMLQDCPDLLFGLDATDRPIQRPDEGNDNDSLEMRNVKNCVPSAIIL